MWWGFSPSTLAIQIFFNVTSFFCGVWFGIKFIDNLFTDYIIVPM